MASVLSIFSDRSSSQPTQRESFALSLESELEALWRFAFRLACNEDDAEDLVQRTCVRALESQDKYQAQGRLRSWLFQIQHRIWLNEIRARKVRANESLDTINANDLIAQQCDEQQITSSAENKVFYSQVCDAVDRLPEAQRTAMLLVNVEGYSYKEAAEILSVPIGTIMSRLSRARITLGQMQLESSTEKPNIATTLK